QEEKDRRGLLDYDDLIEKTLAMLERVSSSWVHYKLDRGIDHILIDEAQDTSPQQWQIVRALAGEFFAGAGARELKRTIFAVGDVPPPTALPQRAPGLVGIWPPIKPAERRELEAWDAPFDEMTETRPQVQLADRIARHVKRACAQGARAGDVLVLVRQRGPLF